MIYTVSVFLIEQSVFLIEQFAVTVSVFMSDSTVLAFVVAKIA